MTPATKKFLGLLDSSFHNGEMLSAVLSAPVKHAQDSNLPRKQTVRPIELKGKPYLQWELQVEKQQTHLNLPLSESLGRFQDLFGEQYGEAYLFTSENEYAIRITKKGAKLTQKVSQQKGETAPQQHNRTKNYLIPEGTPCRFLAALGIMNAKGHVRQSRQKKFRQINRYLEIVNDIYTKLPDDGPLRVVDFGCGLSYLTFAVHHLLSEIHQREVILLGIDQKQDVIQRCETLASELDLAGFTFSTGRIEDAEQPEKVHLALSLHACDTATDAALKYAVNANAEVILAVPCCQHEVFPQIANDDLNLILKHGILKERVAALATDALRAAALEAVGYKTQIMEFIDLEHTPKNLLIRAVKRQSTNPEGSRKRYETLKSQLRINTLSADQIFADRLDGAGVGESANKKTGTNKFR